MKPIFILLLTIALGARLKTRVQESPSPQLLTVNVRNRSHIETRTVEETFGITTKGKANLFNVINIMSYTADGRTAHVAQKWDNPLMLYKDIFPKETKTAAEAQLEVWKHFNKAGKTVLLSAFAEDTEEIFNLQADKTCLQLGNHVKSENFDGVNLDFFFDISSKTKVSWVEKCLIQLRGVLPQSDYVIGLSVLADSVFKDSVIVTEGSKVNSQIDLFTLKLYGNSGEFTTFDSIFKKALRTLLLEGTIDPNKIILAFNANPTNKEYINANELKKMIKKALSQGYVFRGAGSSLMKLDPESAYSSEVTAELKGKIVFEDSDDATTKRKKAVSPKEKLNIELKYDSLLRSKFSEAQLASVESISIESFELDAVCQDKVSTKEKRTRRLKELREMNKELKILAAVEVFSVEDSLDKIALDCMGKINEERVFDGVNLKIMNSLTEENTLNLVDEFRKEMKKDQIISVTGIFKEISKVLPKVDTLNQIMIKNTDEAASDKLAVVVLDECFHSNAESKKISLPDFEMRTYGEIGKTTGLSEENWQKTPFIKNGNDTIYFDNLQSLRTKTLLAKKNRGLYLMLDKFTDFDFFLDLVAKSA